MLVPGDALAVSLLTDDVNLGKVDDYTDILVSLHISNDSWDVLLVGHINVELETNSMDGAAFLLQILDHVKDLVGFGLHPVHIGGVEVVIVEELGFGISSVGPSECLAHEVWYSHPWAVPVKFVLLAGDGLVNDVPCESFALVSLGGFGDVVPQECLEFLGILLPANEVWLVRLLHPGQSVTSEGHVVFLGVIIDRVTHREV